LIEPAMQNDLAAFLKDVSRAPHSGLLLDYDGTLAPFRTERDQALPYAGVAPALQAIVTGGRTHVFIVTGRKTDDIVSLLGIYPCPEIWGLHGTQRRKPHGTVEMACVDEVLVQALMQADDWLQTQGLRQMAEFKPGSIAVHWRGLSERQATDVRRRVLLGWCPVAERASAELLEFDGGIELRALEPDKGDAVRSILEQFDASAPVAYLGDDKTDERAFCALEGRGLRVLVRPQWRETAADIWLRPPDELLEFLAYWLKASQ
jgi:trehalose-phosphatase